MPSEAAISLAELNFYPMKGLSGLIVSFGGRVNSDLTPNMVQKAKQPSHEMDMVYLSLLLAYCCISVINEKVLAIPRGETLSSLCHLKQL